MIPAKSPGERLRHAISSRGIMPFIGIYDVFSAGLTARHFDAIFCSGFGFAASHYGLPDIGFIAWSDLVDWVVRVRTILPEHHILVDIDDGYCDTEVACHVAALLERAGASGVVIEDQQRPRRCGHLDGKLLMDVPDFVRKLEAVLKVRQELFVVARTDASEPDEIDRRVRAFAEAGADAILVDGVKDLDTVQRFAASIQQPFAFNQIAGGKSPACSLADLRKAGVRIVIYSTPCLFAAQTAIDEALRELKQRDGLLDSGYGKVGVRDCTALLADNHISSLTIDRGLR